MKRNEKPRPTRSRILYVHPWECRVQGEVMHSKETESNTITVDYFERCLRLIQKEQIWRTKFKFRWPKSFRSTANQKSSKITTWFAYQSHSPRLTKPVASFSRNHSWFFCINKMGKGKNKAVFDFERNFELIFLEVSVKVHASPWPHINTDENLRAK